MPSALVFNDWRIDAVKIAAARNCIRDGDGITHLYALWLRIGGHREISNCARKTGRRIWRQRLYLKCHRFAFDLNLTAFAKLIEWIRKERIGEWVILIKQVERRTGPRAWCALPARNDNLGLRFYRPDFKFARACRGNCGFVCYHLIKSAADRFSIFTGLL